jgi:DNA repair protein RecN (Recombination protein N)
LSGRIESDPARLDAVEERLSAIYRVVKKHGGSVAKALEKRAQMQAELSRIENGGE